jgi:hypothetical protein
MTSPRPLGQRELELIRLYANCHLGMSPRTFEAKWNVTRSQMAAICQCSLATVQRWFERGANFSPPTRYHLRYLALADLFIEHFEEIPDRLKALLCPMSNSQE